MTVVEKIQKTMPELTKSEKKLAEYIINNPADVLRYSSADYIVSLNNCSRTSLIRLCQKLGYSGFLPFKKEFAKEMISPIGVKEENILSYYSNAITSLNQLQVTDSFKKAINILNDSKHIYAHGFAHSGYSAKQLVFRLTRLGYNASTINDGNTLKEITDLQDYNNCLVIFSISGGNNYSIGERELIKEDIKAKKILLTMTSDGKLVDCFDASLILPCVSRNCHSTLIDDAPTFFMAIELIINYLVKSNNK